MTPRRSETLPEPRHPFSRWAGGATVAIWALGVQALPPALKAIAALFTPAAGYLVGHLVDGVVSQINRSQERKRQTDDLSKNKSAIEKLYLERDTALSTGCDPSTLKVIDEAIEELNIKRIRLIKQTAG